MLSDFFFYLLVAWLKWKKWDNKLCWLKNKHLDWYIVTRLSKYLYCERFILPLLPLKLFAYEQKTKTHFKNILTRFFFFFSLKDAVFCWWLFWCKCCKFYVQVQFVFFLSNKLSWDHFSSAATLCISSTSYGLFRDSPEFTCPGVPG